jgi:sec-independent protein translocase protein TatA
MEIVFVPQLGMVFGSPTEIAIIAGVILVLFGGTRVAGFGKSLGDGIKSFKKGISGEDEATAPTIKSEKAAAPKSHDEVEPEVKE